LQRSGDKSKGKKQELDLNSSLVIPFAPVVPIPMLSKNQAYSLA